MAGLPDILIVGGGVIGMSLGRALAKKGAAVLLLDRTECGREASWAGAGIISPCNPHRADELAGFTERSLGLYPRFCAELADETGIDPEYDRCGVLEVALTENMLRVLRSDERAGAGQTMPDGQPVYQLRTPQEARRLEPALSEHIHGALECRATAQVRNTRLLAALRAACDIAGVTVREHTPVESLVVDEGRVVGARAGGEEIRSGRVVLCGGAWSSRLHPDLPELMDVHPVRGQMILLKLDERPFARVLMRGRRYLVPRRDGHVLLGSTEEHAAGYNKRNTPRGVSRLMDAALRMAPGLAEAPMVGMWSGLRPGTADNQPYLGPVPGFDGLWAATGHFRAGLTLAPATAEALTALLLGEEYEIDLSPFAPGRGGLTIDD